MWSERSGLSTPRVCGLWSRRETKVLAAGPFRSAAVQLPGRMSIDMWRTCSYVHRMSRMIQIRNVPDALHRRLKARAALEGKSLSDYLLAEIREVAERPTVEDLRARLARRAPVAPSIEPALAVRAERDQP
jgi:antitoxin FitA